METETKSPERWPGVSPNRDAMTGRFIAGPIGNVEERFWNKVTRTETCWFWQATTTARGYGLLTHNGQARYAHRFSYELYYGPIPDGLQVLHRCDEPSCVRPEHLFLGTQQDNMQDAKTKGRIDIKGERNPSAKLTESDVRTIRRMLAEGTGPVSVAREFNVSYALIRKIRRGELWPATI